MTRTTAILAVALAGATLAGSARADEDLDAVLAKIGPLADRGQQRMLERLAREPRNEMLYKICAAEVYNAGKRKEAISLLKLGIRKAAHPKRVLATLRAIYRYELDLEALEGSCAGELDQAIRARSKVLPSAVTGDRVLAPRLRPKYLAVYKKMPEYGGLFQLMRGWCSRSPAELEEVLRTRVTGVPGDEAAAGELLHVLVRQKRWKLLAEGGADLPEPVRRHRYYLYNKARALLELGRRKEALATTDQAAKALASYSAAWEQVAEMYDKLGKRSKAVHVVGTYAQPADHRTALALGRYKDAEGVRACVERCLDRDAPAWVLFRCVDACRAAGLNKRAEQVFDIAETECFTELARDHRPAFNLPYEIRYRYEKEGRQARLMRKFAETFAGHDKEIASMLRSLCENLALHRKYDEAAALAGEYDRQKPRQPEFMAVYADMLERARKREHAMEIYRQASTMPAAGGGALSRLQRRHRALTRAAAATPRTRAATTPARAPQPVPAPAKPPAAPPQPKQGVEELTALVKKSPRDGALHARLGVALIRSGRWEQGRQELRKALGLGLDFELLGPFREHRSSIMVIRTHPARYAAVLETYLRSGRREELEADFQPLLSRSNAHRAAHLALLAKFLRLYKRPAEAAAIYRQLAELDPYHAESYQEEAAALTAPRPRP